MIDVVVPKAPTADQLAAGEALVRAWLPELHERKARELAAEVFDAMIEARPREERHRYPGLTRKQSLLLELIREHVRETGLFPTAWQLAKVWPAKERPIRTMIRALWRAGYVKPAPGRHPKRTRWNLLEEDQAINAQLKSTQPRSTRTTRRRRP